MKIIEPYYEIWQSPDGEECLKFLERCARVCYKSEGKIDDGAQTCVDCGGSGLTDLLSYERRLTCKACNGKGKVGVRLPSSHRIIQSIIERGHESVIEHMVITVKFVIDRGISHELVRHRIASFSQESTRYCRYDGNKDSNEVTFIRPCFWEVASPLYLRWIGAMQCAEDAYLDLLAGGAKPEEARSVLPNSLKTEVVVTANIREWRSSIFALRTTPRAHVQMRQVMVPLLAEVKGKIPILFDDIGV